MLGTDVPPTFEPLEVGPIILGEVRPPGYLRSRTVRQIGADVGGSVAVAQYAPKLLSLPGTNLTK